MGFPKSINRRRKVLVPPALQSPAKGMSDDELRAACKPRSWEKRADRMGCLFSLIASACAAAGLAWFGLELAGFRARISEVVVGGGILFPALSIGLFFSIKKLADRRRAPFRAELGYRYGIAPLDVYVAEERLETKKENGPTCSLLLTATALPYGGNKRILVRIWKGPRPRAYVEVRAVRWRVTPFEIESSELARGEAELPGEVRTQIVELMDKPGPSSLSTLGSRGYDGLPCTLTVIEQETDRVHSASCNLAGLTDDLLDHPTVRFAQAILLAGGHVPGPELLTGWCDQAGRIGLGTA